MNSKQIHIVTGAFGFSGKYIAGRLLDAGYEVRTLTNSPHRENPFGGGIKAYPYNFDNPKKLIESLQGVSVLYNNYWVRFNCRDFSYAKAVENTLKLFDAAKKAGIKRIVHVSITNPSGDSPFEYFSGKAKIEKALIESGISYAILRPAVLFGKEDILINNIAWFLRRFPVFGVFGDGNYRLQPIYVDDLAKLAVEQGQKTENCVIDAIGPETFTYRELIEEIGDAIGKRRLILYIPPPLGYLIGSIVGKIFGDVTITRDEIDGLMADLLYTKSHPTGKTRLSDWVNKNASTLGIHYSSELARRKDREKSYEKL
ncbi:MAG: NAD(P)H-binding protein [Nitrospirae bacterium]|nr:NAD(P)H-binding protein [Nitrospirota bacterium]MBI3377107.1 NAD(P)H-binding protein [Nitrospirota bacterium]